MPTGRPTLHVTFDEDTYQRLRELCLAEGVTTTGLLEAFARLVTERKRPAWVTDLVRMARRIDGERRQR